MKKAGFDHHIVFFFANYLVDRRTNYSWNNFSSHTFYINVGVDQGSVLSPILSALYLSSFIYILENYLKNLKIPTSFISFINDGLFISQSNLIDISNSWLYCSYNILINLLEKFSLVVEHSKTEIFHFNRSHGVFNLPPLNLSPLGENVLWPNNTWKYLEFIFNRKLTFYKHVDFYVNKSISTVKCMKMLGNSNYSINKNISSMDHAFSLLPSMVFSCGFTNMPQQHIIWRFWKNTKMCCNIDIGSFQNLSFVWCRSHSGAYYHQTPPSKTWW